MSELSTLAAPWLATWLVHSTLLYGVAWLIERTRLLRAPAACEHLWRAAMLGALLTSGLQGTGLVERLPLRALLPGTAAAATPAAIPAAVPALAPRDAQLAPVAPRDDTPAAQAVAHDPRLASRRAPQQALPSARATAADTPVALASLAPAGAATEPMPAASLSDRARALVGRHWAGVLIAVWLIGACVAGLRLLAAGRLARRELAGRSPADGVAAAELAALCLAQGVRIPALSVAPMLAGPVSLPNGEIVVPPWSLATLGARRRRAMLAHELAHQVRRDPQWQTLALLLHAPLWLQPLHGLARRRLAALAELQADAWAARAVQDPRALAECLAACAEQLADNRAALFGAAMTRDSLLVERVNQLLEGTSMRTPITPWPLRGAVLATLAAATFVFPGCDLSAVHLSGSSTTISFSDDGESKVTLTRPGVSLKLQCDGRATFAEDESDLATLASGCRFTLDETRDGVRHLYKVTSDSSGTLTRQLEVDGAAVAMDDAARAWLAAALPRLFRETGYDAEARIGRLLARGGPAAVLDELDLTESDYARARMLGMLMSRQELDDAAMERALAVASRIDSDFELRQVLTKVFASQTLAAGRSAQLLNVAAGIGSDFDKTEVLVQAARSLPEDAVARDAWVASARTVSSDFDLGRALDAALARSSRDGAFTAQLIGLAADEVDSDFTLRTVLTEIAARGRDPQVATAYLAAVRKLGSDFDNRAAVTALLDVVTPDAANLATALDIAGTYGSNFDKSVLLKALAPMVARDADLNRQYRDIASRMDSFERGSALTALDDASR